MTDYEVIGSMGWLRTDLLAQDNSRKRRDDDERGEQRLRKNRTNSDGHARKRAKLATRVGDNVNSNDIVLIDFDALSGDAGTTPKSFFVHGYRCQLVDYHTFLFGRTADEIVARLEKKYSARFLRASFDEHVRYVISTIGENGGDERNGRRGHRLLRSAFDKKDWTLQIRLLFQQSSRKKLIFNAIWTRNE